MSLDPMSCIDRQRKPVVINQSAGTRVVRDFRLDESGEAIASKCCHATCYLRTNAL